jgi:hypothetical protein
MSGDRRTEHSVRPKMSTSTACCIHSLDRNISAGPRTAYTVGPKISQDRVLHTQLDRKCPHLLRTWYTVGPKNIRSTALLDTQLDRKCPQDARTGHTFRLKMSIDSASEKKDGRAFRGFAAIERRGRCVGKGRGLKLRVESALNEGVIFKIASQSGSP